jgi:three-Cys-motif partner protein
MSPRRTKNAEKSRGFGGEWTDSKLRVLQAYLAAYTKALRDKPTKEHPFRKAYIDAFAGTGSRDARDDAADGRAQELLFPDLAEKAPQELLDGSARLALKTEPRFDRYVFIERNAKRCAELATLKTEFPKLASSISIRNREANVEIQDMCSKDWRSRRAVLFLDPYGMQVEWKTLKAVAGTKAIDMWLLFPFGIGINRLLTKSGDIPTSWRKRLDLLLGNTDWYEEFYKVETTPTLFGDEQELVKTKMRGIARSFNRRLQSVFAGVVEEPGVLRNSRGSPLYLLWFAAGNAHGKDVAIRIATHLLKGLH